MDRIIFHCDCNGFFASVEELLNPELKKVPMAVAGDPESRHGIILAKNELAKKYKVQTAEPIWQAKRKCPGLVCVPPHHEIYSEISKQVNGIYIQYTDLVEKFGIDESFLDLTGTLSYHNRTQLELANGIRERVKREIGITISVGVSFCKVFAKLGSDYKKPDAVTVFDRESIERLVYPLPASDMLYVGKHTAEALEGLRIKTIGELAKSDRELLIKYLGKQGDTLWRYANGLDNEPVKSFYAPREVKSVGNGMTFRRDISGWEEIRSGAAALADSIAVRLREEKLKCTVVQVTIKDPAFRTISRQKKLDHGTYLQKEITDVAMGLIRENWSGTAPIRMLTLTGAELIPEDAPNEQLSLFEEKRGYERQEKLEDAMARIRDKFGGGSIGFGYFDNEETGVRRGLKKRDKARPPENGEGKS